MSAAPTYRIERTDAGQTIYHCLQCEAQGQEHHATDEALFIMHMEQRHDGRMVEAPSPAPASAPPAPQRAVPGPPPERTRP